MIIEIKEKITISPENEALISVVAKDLGYTGGDVREFVSEFFIKDRRSSLENLISPSVRKYFGVVMESKANQVIALLPEAIEVDVKIT